MGFWSRFSAPRHDPCEQYKKQVSKLQSRHDLMRDAMEESDAVLERVKAWTQMTSHGTAAAEVIAILGKERPQEHVGRCPYSKDGVCQECPGWVTADPHICDGTCLYIEELHKRLEE